jgi:nitrite reductase/ring-hydroxylating ferredoxin subunit
VSERPDFWRDEENPARPASGTALLMLADLADGQARAFDFVAGEARCSILVARIGDEARAYLNICPHARFPLETPDGRVIVQEKRFLLCAAHGASFRIEDGACVGGPGLGLKLRRVAVAVDADGVVRMG